MIFPLFTQRMTPQRQFAGLVLLMFCCAGPLRAQEPVSQPGSGTPPGDITIPPPTGSLFTRGTEDELPLSRFVGDPIEPFNRISYGVSDAAVKLIVAPITKGYRFVVPDRARRCIVNAGENLAFPVRVVNTTLQGNFRGSRIESERFLVNSTVGILGLFDPAKRMGLEAHREDFGQTFGHYGSGPGFYLFLPLLGPSSGRDTIGKIGDTALNPATYIPFLNAFIYLNQFSYRVDDYELLSQAESDPYLLLREYWALDRKREVVDYEIPASAYTHEPAQTLEAVLLRPSTDEFRVKGPERRVKIESTGGKLPYSLWMQDGPAPLVVLLPGIGSHRNGQMNRAIAEFLHKDGFSVVAISSTFNWEFIESASTAPVPGYSPVDAADIRDALDAVLADLRGKYGESIQSTALMGISLGAMHTLFIAADEQRRVEAGRGMGGGIPQFDHYVAINPPVDPLYALDRLDGYYNAPKEWPAKTRDHRVAETLMKALALTQGPPPDAQGDLPFDVSESRFLIGVNYRLALRNAIFDSQKRKDAGVLKHKYHPLRREPLYNEIAGYSYHAYMGAFVMPYHRDSGKEKRDEASLVRAAGLRSVGKELAANPRVRVLTNQNDFILKKDDLEWLKQTFGERLALFDGGGHLGNLYHDGVQKTVVEALKAEAPKP